MYTLADARAAARSTCSSAGRRPTGTPTLVDDGALNVVVVGGGPTGIESVGALAELYRSDFARDYPQRRRRSRRALILVEAGPELFTMFKEDIRDYTQKALEKRTSR